jgi:LytS/YehU family sensor histidine kinase
VRERDCRNLSSRRLVCTNQRNAGMQFDYFPDFIKDTCLLIVIAYVLSRGRLLRLLFARRLNLYDTLLLGALLGSISLGVSLLPDVGFRYSTVTLFAAFATLVGGPYVGLIVAVFSSLTMILVTPNRTIATLVGVLVSWVLAGQLHRRDTVPMRLTIGFIAGALAQASRIIVHNSLAGAWHIDPLPASALFSIPSNGFGVALLLLVVSDAQVRAKSEVRRIEADRLRLEAERAHALASEARLVALRARIHPHFLFNALNSIAALCQIAPDRAEAACVNLSQLMHQALETASGTTISLKEELDLVRAYLQIEQERLDGRLNVAWRVDPDCDDVCVVPFSVQVLAENAITHGLANKLDPGSITVTVRPSRHRVIFAVRDNGVGISKAGLRRFDWESDQFVHGLQIVSRQLTVTYGNRARVRLFSGENVGTLAVFALPTADFDLSRGRKHYDLSAVGR